MEKAVFLDRDGTINEEMGYVNHPSRFQIFEFAAPAIRKLNDIGFKVIILTNQSGLARGYFDEKVLEEVHTNLLNHLSIHKARIDKIYHCPHHIEGSVKKFTTDCDCRKPKPGMLKRAEREFNISLKESYLIGDRYKDIQFGQKSGLTTIMVLTGYGLGEHTYQKNQWTKGPDFICKNLLDAADIICENELHKNV